jgi:hypothetical protein
VNVITIDYSSASLAIALAAQDAVLCLLCHTSIGDLQIALLDTSIIARFKRFLPSEWGLNNAGERVLALVTHRRENGTGGHHHGQAV